MIAAVIDLGTNTFNLLIAQTGLNKEVKILFRTKKAVKLLQQSKNEYLISTDAISRAADTLIGYKKLLHKFNVEKTILIGTSAIRNAKNQSKFISEIKNKTGFVIEVISGEKEAEYIYYGVKSTVQLNSETVLILDIGGGSNEFIIANANELLWKKSYEMGIARLIKQFKLSDPITKTEIEQLENYFTEKLPDLKKACEEFNVKKMLGSSGSFDTLTELIESGRNPAILKNNSYYEYNMDEYIHVHDALLNSTLQERLNMPGMIQLRADMIVVASVLIHYVIKYLSLEKLSMSTASLKEGVLYKKILN